jgi:hypothetical protein
MSVRYLIAPVVAAAVALLPMAANAQPAQPLIAPKLTVSEPALVGCGSVVVRGSGYDKDETVETVVSTTPSTGPRATPEAAGDDALMIPPMARSTGEVAEQIVHANSDGAFNSMVRLSKVGLVTITATGTRSGAAASVEVAVLPPACGMASDANSSRLLRVGAVVLLSSVLILLLGALVWRGRRSWADGSPDRW